MNQVSVISWRSAWLSVLLAEGLNCALYIAFALILRPQALDAFTTVRYRRHTTVGTPPSAHHHRHTTCSFRSPRRCGPACVRGP